MTKRAKSGSERRDLHEGRYVERFASQARAAAEPAWLARAREEAIASFAEQGFPHRRLEEWRYTNVAPLLARFYQPADARAAGASSELSARLAGAPEDAIRVVFVDGRLRGGLPAGEAAGGIQVRSIASLLEGSSTADHALLTEHLTRLAASKSDAFTALNTAFFADGAVVEIPAGCNVQRPIHLVFASRGGETVSFPRVLVVARRGSRAVVVQDHLSIGAGARFVDAVSEVAVEANAELELLVLQREQHETLLVSNLQTRQERDGRLAIHSITLGGALVRNELGALLADAGAELALRGLFLGTDDRHVDNHTLVDHAMPHCTSRQLYKGVLADRSRGVFRGRVIVRPHAQKSDAQQSNPNLLLSDRAEIDSKPQLEIRADDVHCSHGSTIGQLDADALFYLRSRGIGEREARALLVRGFVNEIGERLPLPSLVEWVQGLLEPALDALSLDGDARGAA